MITIVEYINIKLAMKRDSGTVNQTFYEPICVNKPIKFNLPSKNNFYGTITQD